MVLIRMKTVCSNIKTMNPYIKIAVVTGVARFARASIFSDLNNLRNISFENEFAAICGVTTTAIISRLFLRISSILSV